MRHLAIGDIHGCLSALENLVDFVGIDGDDVVITLGDYVNRGPDTYGVIEWLMDWHAGGHLFPLRGNHEIMMLEARENHLAVDKFIRAGGDKTLQSYDGQSYGKHSGSIENEIDFEIIPNEHWRFLEMQLLPYYEIDTHFFVHANACPDMPLDEQPEFMTYWEKFDDPPRHESGKIMICGHTSQKNGYPDFNENAICIDTWAHGNGWLSCLHVESGFVWQADKHGSRREFFLDEINSSS